MKVLLVSDFYPPQVGGMEQHVRSLARQLILEGHDVQVATTAPADGSDVLDGIVIHGLRGTWQRLSFAFANHDRRYPPPLVDPELVLKLRRRFDSFRADVIHAHGWIAYSVAAANARPRRPLVVTLHDYGYFCVKRTLFHTDTECGDGRGLGCLSCARSEYGYAKSFICYAGTGLGFRLIRAVDEFIAISKYVRDRYLTHLPRARIHVIPNFLNPLELAAERDPGACADLPSAFVAFVGVLAPFKGVGDLIEAFRIAKGRSEALRDVDLVLLGPPHPSARYESDPSDGIRVVASPSRGMVVEAMARCRCLIVPSRWPEPQGRVVMEGVCAGRPIIGTDAGGIPELLHDLADSAIVPKGAPLALAQAIEAICQGGASRSGTGAWGGPPGYLPLDPTAAVTTIVRIYEHARMRRPLRHGLATRDVVLPRPSTPGPDESANPK